MCGNYIINDLVKKIFDINILKNDINSNPSNQDEQMLEKEFFGLNIMEETKNSDLIGKSPIDAFLVRLKVSFFLGFLISLPIILFEAWEFIKPGLKENERKYVFYFITLGSILGIGGALFCHILILPLALKFFYSQYELLSLKPIIHFNDYITLLIKLDLTFALVFELPIILVILAKINLIDSNFLKKYFRHSIVVIFTLAAILTPPDIITQVLMALPLIVLYGLSILLVKILVK